MNELLLNYLTVLQHRIKDKSDLLVTGGICSNFKNMLVEANVRQKQFNLAVAALETLMAKWPEYSGSEIFPIPGGARQYVAHKEDPFGEHAYGQMREKLLAFCLESLAPREGESK